MIINTLKFIANHPFNATDRLGAILRFFRWQLNTRLNPYPIVYPYTEKTKLLMWRGLTGATGNLYCGLLEYQDMGFLLHLLRPGDTFMDIGANIGVYTILASGEVGANTIAVEPVPLTYKRLMDNVFINQMGHRVKALNIGLGSKKGNIRFTQGQDAENHVALEGEQDTVEVAVDTLDHIAEPLPLLIKMDVEGFETEVLNGAGNTLANTALKAIIIELNGAGKKYGYNEDDIHAKLLGLGFQPHAYDPLLRQLAPVASYGKHNTIYIRDVGFVKQRLASAPKVKIRDRAL